jgi:hypothetical protein
VLNKSLDKFVQNNPVFAQGWLKIGAYVVYQHGYVQQFKIILMVPEYGMTDIYNFVGDWLLLVGFSWFQ